MTPLLRVAVVASIAVVLFDLVLAIGSSAIGFSYSWGVLGSYAIYSAAGVFAGRASPGREVLGATAAGAAVGLVDASVGWAVSAAIGPGRTAAVISPLGWVAVALFVMATAGGIAAISAALSLHRSGRRSSAL